MNIKILKIAALSLLSLPFIAACATTTTTVESKKPSADLVWPRPPDKARISYIESFSNSFDVEGKPGFLASLMEEKQTVYSLSQPYSVSVDDKGRIYTVDQPFIVVFDKQGKKYSQILSLDKIQLAFPIGVTVGPDETIFVSDGVLKAVLGFDQGRKLQFIVGGDDGCGESIFARPTGLAIDRVNKRLYIADTKKHQVFAYDLKGQYLFSIGERGNEQGFFNYPTNIAVDKNGDLYVTDEGNFRVQIFDSAGKAIKVIGHIGTRFGEFARPKGVAVDSEGHIYVVDAAFQNFQIFNGEGRLLMFVGEGGQGPGQFTLPSGIFIDGEDRIYVADRMNHRIQVFQYLGEKWKEKQALQAKQAEQKPADHAGKK